MILVRDEIHGRQGDADKLVEQFRAASEMLKSQDVIKRGRILTDLSGPFDTVVIELEIESVDAYLALMRSLFADPDRQAAEEARTAPTYQSGARTFYTIEAEFAQDE